MLQRSGLDHSQRETSRSAGLIAEGLHQRRTLCDVCFSCYNYSFCPAGTDGRPVGNRGGGGGGSAGDIRRYNGPGSLKLHRGAIIGRIKPLYFFCEDGKTDEEVGVTLLIKYWILRRNAEWSRGASGVSLNGLSLCSFPLSVRPFLHFGLGCLPAGRSPARPRHRQTDGGGQTNNNNVKPFLLRQWRRRTANGRRPFADRRRTNVRSGGLPTMAGFALSALDWRNIHVRTNAIKCCFFISVLKEYAC